MKYSSPWTALTAVALLTGAMYLNGCGSAVAQSAMTDPSAVSEDHQAQVKSLEKQLADQRAALAKAEADARRAADDAVRARAEATSASANAAPGGELLPPGAKAGQCYARVLVPPVYENYSEQVLIREASDKIQVVPANYEWDAEKVLVKEASNRLEVVPAKYEWVEEKILVKPERTELKVVPAEFRTETEQILVQPARTYWKKGRGLVEKVDNTTGEIVCLVEEPEVYRTVSRQVLVKPETVKEVRIPAEYETVRKMVLKQAATTKTVEIPAEYEQVKVLKQTKGANQQKTTIPAEYRPLAKQRMVKDSYLEWRQVLCETNMTTGKVSELQRALSAKGFDPGPIDGVYGPLTLQAVTAFQKANTLPTGGLTYRTLEKLEVRP
ncbi:peptidoglycan-binding protein [bacterium]|nr:peptidoglycan-binding protein [bacterium]